MLGFLKRSEENGVLEKTINLVEGMKQGVYQAAYNDIWKHCPESQTRVKVKNSKQ